MRTSLYVVCGLLGLSAVGCSDDGATGKDGRVSLVRTERELPGEQCAQGGTAILAGIDDNGNGRLDAGEATTTSYVCNGAAASEGRPGADGQDGANGQDGADGEDGVNGTSSLIETVAEAPGANCAYGGYEVSTGLDIDADGTLAEREVRNTIHVCHGKPASASAAGFHLVGKYVTAGGPIAEIVAATPDGHTLVFTSSVNHTVEFVDISNPALPSSLGVVDIGNAVANAGSGEATSVVVTSDGRYALVAVKDALDPIARADAGALVFIDVATRTIVGNVELGVGPDSIALTPDGSRAIIAIEDEEDAENNGAEQARSGAIQFVTLDHEDPSASRVRTLELAPELGNLPGDVQPEYVAVAPDGATAIVSLQENNLIAVIDLETEEVSRFIDAGTSNHALADVLDDGEIHFTTGNFSAQLQPDSVCMTADGAHFLSANEGDLANEAIETGVFSGGRGFSVFAVDGERVYDSGDAAELLAVRAGAYPDGRSDAKGVEFEGCATAVFGATESSPGTEYAFLLGERNATLTVLDLALPSAPVPVQILGAPMRPEGVTAIPARGLVVVSGEGDGVGGGLWIYAANQQAGQPSYGEDVYHAISDGTPFGALGALTWEPGGRIVATPDNAFDRQRIWWFEPDHLTQRVKLTRELLLSDAAGAPLTGYDPEGIALNPEGGFVIANEGIAGNGGSTTCVGTAESNRILFVDAEGNLDPAYGIDGIVDLPCGTEANAIDWTTVRANGFEGLAAIDSTPAAAGGLRIYVAMQRALTDEGQNTRIGAYDVDSGEWSFYFYNLDANPGGDAGNTFLSELLHVQGDLFAVIERDQGFAGAAANKTIRTFRLASGGANDPLNPLDKATVADLLTHPFRFDQEKLEGLALGGGDLWISNDNDGGEAINFLVKLDPAVLGE